MLRVALLLCFPCLILAHTTVLTVQHSCDDGVSDVSGVTKKYSLYPVKLNWYQSIHHCHQLGLRLATIDNGEEYCQLVTQIENEDNDRSYHAGYWTAGSNLAEPGKYVWLTTGKPIYYSKWTANGRPYAGGVDKNGERCVELRAMYNYEMMANLCTTEKYVACETTE